MEIGKDDVYMISGWSDRIFDMLEAVENGEDVVQRIENIEL